MAAAWFDHCRREAFPEAWHLGGIQAGGGVIRGRPIDPHVKSLACPAECAEAFFKTEEKPSLAALTEY